MSRLLLPGLTLLVALLGSYGILSTGKVFPDLATPPRGARALPSRWLLENVRLRTYEGARQTVDARASSLEVGPARAGLFTLPTLRQARMKDLDATLTGEAGRPTRVRADRVKIDSFRRAWILEGNVRVEGPDARMACAKLRWDPKTGFLPSPGCRGGVLPVLPKNRVRTEISEELLPEPRG